MLAGRGIRRDWLVGVVIERVEMMALDGVCGKGMSFNREGGKKQEFILSDCICANGEERRLNTATALIEVNQIGK